MKSEQVRWKRAPPRHKLWNNHEREPGTPHFHRPTPTQAQLKKSLSVEDAAEDGVFDKLAEVEAEYGISFLQAIFLVLGNFSVTLCAYSGAIDAPGPDETVAFAQIPSGREKFD